MTRTADSPARVVAVADRFASGAADLARARQALSARKVELAPESELRTLFPDCELGAVPPFGSEYGLTTVVDEPLTHDDYIVFDGNSHHEAISMSYGDFAAIEHPRIAELSHRN
ncbi:MAG: YbaK/EbsC family protein [Planctomycetales bacterium]